MLVGIYFSKPASGAALKAMASAGAPLANRSAKARAILFSVSSSFRLKVVRN
jgi:hypothetical protein